jgi:hypothetical protein
MAKHVMALTMFYMLNSFSVLCIGSETNQDTQNTSPAHVMVWGVLLECSCTTSTTTVNIKLFPHY